MMPFFKRQLTKSFLHAVATAENGHMTVTHPDGTITRYGRMPAIASPKKPVANLIVHDWGFLGPVVTKGDIGFAETYIDGLWDSDDVESLIAFFLCNIEQFNRHANGHPLQQFIFGIINNALRRNSRNGSRANIRSHYDVGNDFYKLWLDSTMTYSSALYATSDTKLENAQQAKYQRILQRLEGINSEILEIGCGWGGFAEEAAAQGHRVTGITVSNAQHDYATRRLGNKADIRLEDYRDTQGTFANIVSIEMFEAVGEKYWPTYFETIKNRLAKNGKAVIQTITIDDRFFDDYKKRSDFIRHYIFPGGLLPAVSSFQAAANKAGLDCSEPFSFGHDYARTLREWLTRFNAAGPAIEKMGYSPQFMRSWRMYLAMCAAAFAVDRTNVVHFELTHAA